MELGREFKVKKYPVVVVVEGDGGGGWKIRGKKEGGEGVEGWIEGVLGGREKEESKGGRGGGYKGGRKNKKKRRKA